ncbi:MAG: hypothetical protein ACXVDA_16335 [Ktedonobacterales bacterium]
MIIRGRIHHLLGVVLLATLWVTSLANLSTRATATGVLTEIGANVLNPYLAANSFGLAEKAYGGLQSAATAHPNDALSLPFLKVQIKGRDIAGRNFADGTRIIYSKVAEGYYDNGPTTVFNLPSQLSQAIDTYGLFLATGSTPQNLPAGVNLPHLPSFLQPLFIATGLSPYTLTAQGHDRIMSFLLWFWVATLVLAALALLLDTRSLSRRFSKLFLGSFTGTLPAVLLIAGVWALAAFNPQTAAPYMGMLRLVTSSFLPVYGGAFAVSGIALILFKVVPMLLGHGAAPAPAPAFREPAPVAVAPQPRYQPSYQQPDAYPQSSYAPSDTYPQSPYPSAGTYPQTNAYPPNPQQQGYQQDYPYPQQRYPFAQEPEYPQQPPRPSNRGGAPNPWSSPDSPTMP